eukprot:Skav221033  [mRNA]  locus=scaffold1448:102159:115189:+ [translate_table: standard]
MDSGQTLAGGGAGEATGHSAGFRWALPCFQGVGVPELSGHFLGYSVQTANSFDVVSVTGGGEHVLSCREVQDLQAMLGMNLAGGLQAMGIDAAGAWAGRDKAPFRMMVGLPPMPNPLESGKMQVIVPQGVSSGQMIQDGDRTVAFITKGWAGGMQELFTSANAFYVDFGEVKDPACKALLLAPRLQEGLEPSPRNDRAG